MPYDPSDTGVAGPKGAHPIPEYSPWNSAFMALPYRELAPRPYTLSEEYGWQTARRPGVMGKEVHVRDQPPFLGVGTDKPENYSGWYEDHLNERPAYHDSIGRALAAMGIGKSLPSVDQAPPDFGSIERGGQPGADFAREPSIKLSELQMLMDIIAAGSGLGGYSSIGKLSARGRFGDALAHERMEPMVGRQFDPMQSDPMQSVQRLMKEMQGQRGLSYPNPMRPGASGIREPFMRPSPVTPSPPQSDVLGGVKNQKGKLEALLKLVDDMFPELGEK